MLHFSENRDHYWYSDAVYERRLNGSPEPLMKRFEAFQILAKEVLEKYEMLMNNSWDKTPGKTFIDPDLQIDERRKPKLGRRDIAAMNWVHDMDKKFYKERHGFVNEPVPAWDFSGLPINEYEQKIGKSVYKEMSHRTERHIRFYNSDEFLQMVNNTSLLLNVGGIDMPMEKLARAGWTLRVSYNPYGGRTKVVFNSADTRSTLCYRVDRTKEDLKSNDYDLLHRVSQGTLNIVHKIITVERVVQKEVVVEPINVKSTEGTDSILMEAMIGQAIEEYIDNMSDTDLLTKVHQRIQARLKAQPKKTKPKTVPPAKIHVMAAS